MRRKFIVTCTLAYILLGITAGHFGALAENKARQPTWIRADEVGKNVQVLGRLGLAIRRVASVSGIWVELDEGPSKPGTDPWFRVMEVDGKRLDQPIDFRSLDVTVYENGAKLEKLALGEHWQLRAYETWPDYDHPADFWKELDQPVPAPPRPGPTRIIGVLQKRIAK